MKVELYTETSGDEPYKERKWFADECRVSWNRESAIPADLYSVIESARLHAENECGYRLRLMQIQLVKVGAHEDHRGWFYSSHFSCIDDKGEPVSVASDLFGKVIEPEVRFFDDEETYCRYKYPSLYGGDDK